MLSESGTSHFFWAKTQQISHRQCLQCFPSPPSNLSWASWVAPALPCAAAAPPRCGAALAWTGCHKRVMATVKHQIWIIFWWSSNVSWISQAAQTKTSTEKGDGDVSVQSGALFLAICYILEQKPVLCWILELNCDCWSTTVLGLNSGIGCYHSVGWFRVGLGFI